MKVRCRLPVPPEAIFPRGGIAKVVPQVDQPGRLRHALFREEDGMETAGLNKWIIITPDDPAAVCVSDLQHAVGRG